MYASTRISASFTTLSSSISSSLLFLVLLLLFLLLHLLHASPALPPPPHYYHLIVLEARRNKQVIKSFVIAPLTIIQDKAGVFYPTLTPPPQYHPRPPAGFSVKG